MLAADRLAERSDRVEVWASIQSILVAAANVSKILWLAKASATRGEHLRKLLDVPDDSFLQHRTIRNHFEHYDERVEEWFKKSASVAYTDSSIDAMEPGPWSFRPFVHRRYDPVTQELHFRDEG